MAACDSSPAFQHQYPCQGGPGQELKVEGCFAPLLQWVRSWWVPTGGRELAQEPLVLAVDSRP